jgi:hypothetical protein
MLIGPSVSSLGVTSDPCTSLILGRSTCPPSPTDLRETTVLTHVEPVRPLLDHSCALSGEVAKVGRENRGGDDAATSPAQERNVSPSARACARSSVEDDQTDLLTMLSVLIKEETREVVVAWRETPHPVLLTTTSPTRTRSESASPEAVEDAYPIEPTAMSSRRIQGWDPILCVSSSA